MPSITRLSSGFILCALLACASVVAHAADPLPSWNDGATKTAIMEFVDKVTKEGSPDFVRFRIWRWRGCRG